MHNYKKILAAVDLTEEAPEVFEVAARVAKEQDAELHLITVVKPITYAYIGYETASVSQAVANFEPEARAHADAALEELCKASPVPPERRHIVFGRPADTIRTTAEEVGADLIVMGSHGRHGLGLLLGSTANGVLHGAACDVLTIRIHAHDAD